MPYEILPEPEEVSIVEPVEYERQVPHNHEDEIVLEIYTCIVESQTKYLDLIWRDLKRAQCHLEDH